MNKANSDCAIDTEIDYSTYMSQISLYAAGERSYPKIRGFTGPLVYPAAHVYIYYYLSRVTVLDWSVITPDTVPPESIDIPFAQTIFYGLYLICVAAVIQAYRTAKCPPWVLPMLVLSKRLHSVFILRLFNDAIAAMAMWISLWLLANKRWATGVAVWSFGVAIKMTLLTAAPGIGVVLVLATGWLGAIGLGVVFVAVQVLIALPFLRADTWGYITKAFELTRVFKYKWTVNWRCVDEEVFLSWRFMTTLMILHAVLLVTFATTRWIKPSGLNLWELISTLWKPLPADKQAKIAAKVTPRFILTTILSSWMIGFLCARSLHYQFFAYIGWCTPFLLWQSGLNPVLVGIVWAAQEWAWNVYPSTPTSSLTVLGTMAIQLAAIWWGTAEQKEVPAAKAKSKSKSKPKQEPKTGNGAKTKRR